MAFFILCAGDAVKRMGSSDLTIHIPIGINLAGETVRAAILDRVSMMEIPHTMKVELSLYSYSSGKEVYFYSEEADSRTLCRGSVKALLKIRKGDRLIRVITLEADGNSMEEIIENLAVQVHRYLLSL